MKLDMNKLIDSLRHMKSDSELTICDIMKAYKNNKRQSWLKMSPEFKNRKEMWSHFKECKKCWGVIKEIKDDGKFIDIASRYIWSPSETKKSSFEIRLRFSNSTAKNKVSENGVDSNHSNN